MKSWFYEFNGSHVGPISSSELRHLAREGAVNPETPVKKGDGNWTIAAKVKGLDQLFENRNLNPPPSQTSTEFESIVEIIEEFKVRPWSHRAVAIGNLCLVLGTILLIAFLFYDTTVSGTYNFGLMQHRLIGFLVSIAFLLVGAAYNLFGRKWKEG